MLLFQQCIDFLFNKAHHWDPLNRYGGWRLQLQTYQYFDKHSATEQSCHLYSIVYSKRNHIYLIPIDHEQLCLWLNRLSIHQHVLNDKIDSTSDASSFIHLKPDISSFNKTYQLTFFITVLFHSHRSHQKSIYVCNKLLFIQTQ